MTRWMFALLMIAALPITAKAENVYTLAVGQSVFLAASGSNVYISNSAPAVVSFFPIERRSVAGVTVWGDVYGLSPGVATIAFDVRFADNTSTVLKYNFVVEGCDAFPKIPPLRVVPAQAGAPVRVDSQAVLAVAQSHFDWYEGVTGDTSRPLSSSNAYYVFFTPAEAKQYHLWYRVFDECATKNGEVIVDATVKPRRHATRR
jgi:hypothetical protein